MDSIGWCVAAGGESRSAGRDVRPRAGVSDAFPDIVGGPTPARESGDQATVTFLIAVVWCSSIAQ